MGRKRGNTAFDALAALPWPLGLAVGIAGFLAVRYGLAWWLSQHGGMLAQGIAQHADNTLAPLAWIVLIVCWISALFSFLGARHRRRLLDTRTTLESLAAGGSRQFELLVGEAYRHQGYSVKEATRFAQGKPIELIGGERLLKMIQAAQRGGADGASLNSRIEPMLVPAIGAAPQARACRQYGSDVAQRTYRRTGGGLPWLQSIPAMTRNRISEPDPVTLPRYLEATSCHCITAMGRFFVNLIFASTWTNRLPLWNLRLMASMPTSS